MKPWENLNFEKFRQNNWDWSSHLGWEEPCWALGWLQDALTSYQRAVEGACPYGVIFYLICRINFSKTKSNFYQKKWGCTDTFLALWLVVFKMATERIVEFLIKRNIAQTRKVRSLSLVRDEQETTTHGTHCNRIRIRAPGKAYSSKCTVYEYRV